MSGPRPCPVHGLEGCPDALECGHLYGAGLNIVEPFSQNRETDGTDADTDAYRLWLADIELEGPWAEDSLTVYPKTDIGTPGFWKKVLVGLEELLQEWKKTGVKTNRYGNMDHLQEVCLKNQVVQAMREVAYTDERHAPAEFLRWSANVDGAKVAVTRSVTLTLVDENGFQHDFSELLAER